MILLGINYYLSDEHWKFLLCFMVAIPGKYMPLFVFIPLVLLKEKRYLYIVRDLVVGCALVVVDRGMNSIGYRIENFMGIDKSLEVSGNDTMQLCFNNLLTSDFEVFNAPISFVVAAFGILCIWCFLQDSKKRNTLAAYVSFIAFSILFGFAGSAPYWVILLVPFQLLLTMSASKYYSVLFPLEAVAMLAYIYIFTFETNWILGSENTFSFLICSLIPGYNDKGHGYVADFFTQRGLNGYEGVMSAILVLSSLAIIALTNPLKKENEEEAEGGYQYIKGWYWARIGIVVGWILLNIWIVMLNHVN